MRSKVVFGLTAALALVWAAGCTGSSSPTMAPPTASRSPSPHGSARPSPAPRPQVQHTLDVASRANGATAVLGQTCFTDGSCTTWVRWSTDAGRTFPRTSQQTVHHEPPPLDGEPSGSTLNRIRLGPRHTAWVWASTQPGEVGPEPLYWTADDGRTWASSGEVGYRDVQPSGDSAWLLGGACHGPPPVRCFTTLTVAPAGTDPDASNTQLPLPGASRTAFALRRVSATEAFLLTGANHGDPPDPPRLWHTRDGARGWQAVRLPRPCDGALHIALAAVSPRLAWVDCQGEAVVTAPATLWRTTDSGRSWEQLAPPPTFRYAADLVLLSPQHALVTSGRAEVHETRDGGRTWRTVLPYQEVGNGPIEPGPGGVLFSVLYQDEQANSVTSGLWRSAGPGERWTKITLGP